MELAVVVAHGDILPGGEAMTGELEACFVALVAGEVIVEGPSAAAMDQMADVLLLVAPEADDATVLAILPPELGIETAVLVERRGEAVAVTIAAGREFRRAGRG